MNHSSPLTPPIPLSKDDKITWGNLHGSSMSLAIYNAAQKISAPLTVITPDTLTATRIEDELNFFKGNNSFEIFSFPDWETLPYDSFSPHQDLISQRLNVLSQLPTLQRGIVLVSLSTLMKKIAPRSYIEGNSFTVKTGERINLEAIRLRFTRCGYQSVAQVLSPGEFAVRGSI